MLGQAAITKLIACDFKASSIAHRVVASLGGLIKRELAKKLAPSKAGELATAFKACGVGQQGLPIHTIEGGHL
jgi:carbonic anhydrase